MGKKPERLHEEFRRSKTGRSLKDLEALLRAFGFEKKEGNKHNLYFHPEHPQLMQTITRSSGDLDPGYVRSAVEAIDRLRAQQKQSEEEGS